MIPQYLSKKNNNINCCVRYIAWHRPRVSRVVLCRSNTDYCCDRTLHFWYSVITKLPPSIPRIDYISTFKLIWRPLTSHKSIVTTPLHDATHGVASKCAFTLNVKSVLNIGS